MEATVTITKAKFEELVMNQQRFKHQALIHEAKVLELLNEIRQLKKHKKINLNFK